MQEMARECSLFEKALWGLEVQDLVHEGCISHSECNPGLLSSIKRKRKKKELLPKHHWIMFSTWFEELTHLKRPWCWERLKAGGEGDDRGCDGWIASLTRWTWVWADSRSWWWTGRPGVLQFMGLQRVRHDWATELNWTESDSRAQLC